MTPAGFPHSGIAGSKDACSSPTLFAAYRALPRLSVPRHPPCALLRLTGKISLPTPNPLRTHTLLPRCFPTTPTPILLHPLLPRIVNAIRNERGLERTRACRAEPGVRPVRTFDQPGREPVLLAYSHLQKGGDPAAGSPTATLLRLRPSHQARLRPLPPLRVGSRTSGAPNFHGVTGGVYKARERIHRGVADPRLLAIPTSCSRVTDCNPNLDRVFPIGSLSRARDGLSRPL